MLVCPVTINGEDHYKPDVNIRLLSLLLFIISLIITIIFIIRVKKHLIEQHERLSHSPLSENLPFLSFIIYKIRIHSAGRKNEPSKVFNSLRHYIIDSNVSHKLYKMSARSWEKRNILDGMMTKKRYNETYYVTAAKCLCSTQIQIARNCRLAIESVNYIIHISLICT